MREFDNDPAIAQTVELMESYSLDLHGYSIQEIITQLLKRYHANWIRLATIEALYLGRYKAVSVEQILRVWVRVGSPNPHFGHEFERLICRKLPRNSGELPRDEEILTATERISELMEEINLKSQLVSPENQLDKTSTEESPSTPDKPDTTTNTIQSPEQTERSPSKQPSIHQFTPLPDASSFYYKLKSLAEEEPKQDEP